MTSLSLYQDAEKALQQVQERSIPVYQYHGDARNLTQGNPVVIRTTLLEQMFGLERFVLLQAKQDDAPDFDPIRWRSNLEYLLGGGIEHEGRHYKIVGASSSLKDGKFWLAEEGLVDQIHQYFSSSQEALAYFGILTSSCHHGIWQLSVPFCIVQDGKENTGDGFGFVPRSLLDQLSIPHRQIQVRFAGESWLGKGTLHPYDGNRIILPKSMLKGTGRPEPNKQYYFGIRDIAQVRNYASNFTVAQWFTPETHQKLRSNIDQRLNVVQQAFQDSESALAFLNMISQWSDEQQCWLDPEPRMRLEEFLKAGLPPTHRYLHNQLKTLTRKAYVELASGGGIKLSGRMMAFAELQDYQVCIPDLPPGKVMISRYPIRDKASFLVLYNHPNAFPAAISGSIYLNENVAQKLDGDFDGDYAIVSTQPELIAEVESSRWLLNYHREEAPLKTRRKDPLHLLPFVAANSLGNSIGYITYLIAGCVAEDKPEYIGKLSAELQSEVQKLKWDTTADWEFIKSLQTRINIPRYLSSFKCDQALFVSHAEPVSSDSVIAKSYNYIARHWRQIDSIPEPLVHFRHLVPLWASELAPDYLPECKAVIGYYNQWISDIIRSKESIEQEDLRPALDFIRAWSNSKTDNRTAWAIAVWNAVHESRSEHSTGSAAFHAFPQETIQLLIQHQGGSLHILPGFVNERPENGYQFDLNGRSYYRCIKEKHMVKSESPQQTDAAMHVVPIVGGWYCSKGNSVAEKLTGFKQNVEALGKQPADISCLRADGQLLFYAGDLCLGQVAKDSTYRGCFQDRQNFQARITMKGRTVYLFLQAKPLLNS